MLVGLDFFEKSFFLCAALKWAWVTGRAPRVPQPTACFGSTVFCHRVVPGSRKCFVVRKSASSSLVVDIRGSGYTVHVAEWLRRYVQATRFAPRHALAPTPRSFFAFFSDAESRVVFAPRLPAFPLLQC